MGTPMKGPLDGSIARAAFMGYVAKQITAEELGKIMETLWILYTFLY
jgi:hypothetical protein